MTRLLADYVSVQAERHPDAVAVVMKEQLSYGQLETQSNQLASLLLQAGCQPDDRVALLVPRSERAIVGMLGVLKAGGIYVPVDLGSPAARVERMLQQVEPRLLLAAPAARDLLQALAARGILPAVPVGTLEEEESGPGYGYGRAPVFTDSDRARQSPASVGRARRAHDAAYILFTSGSTGTPKGVVVTHANVAAFVDWATVHFGMARDDRVAQYSPLHFDPSVFDIYGAFAVGAQLHLVPPACTLDPRRLAGFLRARQVTQLLCVASTLTLMATFDVVKPNDFPALRRVLACGEVLPTPTLQHWMARLPHVWFVNAYGPTETTILSSCYTVPEPPRSSVEAIPIGRACDGEELLILDEQLRPVPAGQVGEVCIGGPGVSRGYWGDEERTRAVFPRDPRDPTARIYRTGDLARQDEDGLLYFHGRADTQVKRLGYRIELGEVEAALDALPGVKEAAVVGVATGGVEGTTLCCAFTGVDEQVTAATLRAELRDHLPAYMLPSRWQAFDRVPTNANGKIDRAGLRHLFESEFEFEHILRRYLRLLPAGQPLDPTALLDRLGLDSLNRVDLIFALEKAFAISFPDEAFTWSTFATPASLWRQVSSLLASKPRT